MTFTATVTGTSPTGSVAFTDGASSIAGCSSVTLVGTGNARTATCTTSWSVAAATPSRSLRRRRRQHVEQRRADAAGERGHVADHVALAANGGVASASSTYGPGHLPANLIDGDTAGTHWGNGGGWADATAGAFPDWVQIDFAGQKTIDHVVVYTVQDNSGAPSAPTDTMTFSQWGVTDFTVQA